jgi:hypothetical protein
MAIEKSDAGDDAGGEREADCPAGQKSLHLHILAQAVVLPRGR